MNPGAPLFIFDENSAVVLGLFQKAVPTDPLETVDANAFHGLLPLQVRFSIVLEAPPLHIMEPDFMVTDWILFFDAVLSQQTPHVHCPTRQLLSCLALHPSPSLSTP